MAHKHAPHVKNDAPGMAGERSRNDNGELRQKRSDTHAGTIQKQYGVDWVFARTSTWATS